MVERRVTGTRTSAVDAERRRRRKSTSDSGWINSDRYCGAAPFRQRCIERKVYTGCVQVRAASAGSRAVVSHVELARISCQSCCSVQHGLNPIKVTLWQSSQGDVTVVHRRQPRRGCRGRIPTNILVSGDIIGNVTTNIRGGNVVEYELLIASVKRKQR